MRSSDNSEHPPKIDFIVKVVSFSENMIIVAVGADPWTRRY